MREKYYEFSRTYSYGFYADYTEGFGTLSNEKTKDYLSGDTTFSSDIEWNESSNKYKVYTHISNTGSFAGDNDSPDNENEQSYYNELESFLSNQGISVSDVEY